MAGSERLPRSVRFGEFELDERSLELDRAGRRVRLQEKPAQALIALLERPGEFISREQLFKRLWPDDTFVDFDNSLNNAISKLRTALGDAADKPRFVETVGRRGYRFIAQVDVVQPASAAAAMPSAGVAPPAQEPPLHAARQVTRSFPKSARLTAATGIMIVSTLLAIGVARGWQSRLFNRATASAPTSTSGTTGAALAGVKPEVALLEATALVENGQTEDAYARVLRARSELPPNAALSFAAAYVLTYAGYLDEAGWALEETLAQDSQYLAKAVYAPNVLLYQRRIDRFLALLPAAETPMVRFYRALADAERGGRGSGAALAQVFEQNPEDVFSRLGLALNAALAGRQAEAHTILQGLSRQRQIAGNHDGEITFKHAQIEGLAGSAERALEELDRAVGEGFVCVRCIEATTLLENVRTLPAGLHIVEQARVRHEAFGRRFNLSERH